MDMRLLILLLAAAALSIIAANLKWRAVFKPKAADEVSSLAGAILMTLIAAGLVAGALWFWV